MKLTIVKIGGNVIDDERKLEAFLSEFSILPSPKILIHGGGKEASRLSSAMGIKPNMIDGRRVTDKETLNIVTMVYAGLINKRIVSKLQANCCNAIGLSGCDGNVIKATKRPPHPIDYGYVGDIDISDVNRAAFAKLLSAGMTLVICAIMHDGNGTLLNCNADTVASSVATALSAEYETDLIYCFELPGVLANIDDPNSIVGLITPSMRDELVDSGVIKGGMIPKIDNAIKAVEGGVRNVVIKPAEQLSVASSGTRIAKR